MNTDANPFADRGDLNKYTNNRVVELLQEAGVTPAELCHHLAWPPRRIERVLDGHSSFKINEITAMCAMLGISTWDFYRFGEVEEVSR